MTRPTVCGVGVAVVAGFVVLGVFLGLLSGAARGFIKWWV